MPDLVAVDLPAGDDFVEALRGAWDGGHAVLPVDQRLGATARATLLEMMDPSVVIGPAGAIERRRGTPMETGDAVVMATSGTTGAPKGVVLTHEAIRASALATSEALGVDPARHRWLSCLPLNHVGGLSVVCRALITSTPLTILPGFDLDAVVAASGPDVLVSLVATTLARVGAERFRTVVLGGSPPPPGLAPNVVSTYGMTETGSGVVYNGVALRGVDIDIDPVDDQVRLRGPMLLRAYRDGTVPLDAEGWYPTGDAGRLDEHGRLHIEGRLSELIITGGENVWPIAVEAILGDHPGVREVAVAGRPDEEWGEAVVAWIVPVRSADPPGLDELRGRVRDALAAYAAPRRLVIVDRLPKTAIGKVQRALLPWPSGQDPGWKD